MWSRSSDRIGSRDITALDADRVVRELLTGVAAGAARGSWMPSERQRRQEWVRSGPAATSVVSTPVWVVEVTFVASRRLAPGFLPSRR